MKEHLDYGFRIRRAIVAVSERQPSHARVMIDDFLRQVSPAFARGYGVEFPHTCRRHPLSPERCRIGTMEPHGRYPLLYFHLGNAILGFYDLFWPRDHKPLDPPVLDARIKLLEEIAIQGFDKFVVDGNDVWGYRLIDMETMRQMQAEENARELAKFQEENAENEINPGAENVAAAKAMGVPDAVPAAQTK